MNELELLRRENEELKSRLQESYKADRINDNNKALTLKKNIEKGTTRQYKDFMLHKSEECNEDNYEALKATLNQVFRTLIRNGIEL